MKNSGNKFRALGNMLRNFREYSMDQVVYTGLFVDDIRALKEKYPPVHENEFYHHSTIDFRPKDGTEKLEIGKKGILKIIGRVTTEKVDVLLVENPKSTNLHPHITLSTAPGVKPFESNNEIHEAEKTGIIQLLDDSLIYTEGYFNGQNKVTEVEGDITIKIDTIISSIKAALLQIHQK